MSANVAWGAGSITADSLHILPPLHPSLSPLTPSKQPFTRSKSSPYATKQPRWFIWHEKSHLLPKCLSELFHPQLASLKVSASGSKYSDCLRNNLLKVNLWKMFCGNGYIYKNNVRLKCDSSLPSDHGKGFVAREISGSRKNCDSFFTWKGEGEMERDFIKCSEWTN